MQGETVTSFLQKWFVTVVRINDKIAALVLGRSFEVHAKQTYHEIIAEEPQITRNLRALFRKLENYYNQLGEGPGFGLVAFY